MSRNVQNYPEIAKNLQNYTKNIQKLQKLLTIFNNIIMWKIAKISITLKMFQTVSARKVCK